MITVTDILLGLLYFNKNTLSAFGYPDSGYVGVHIERVVGSLIFLWWNPYYKNFNKLNYWSYPSKKT